MILSNKGITKALIRIPAGWSVPLLFTNPEDRFSHVKAHFQYKFILWIKISVDPDQLASSEGLIMKLHYKNGWKSEVDLAFTIFKKTLQEHDTYKVDYGKLL